MDSYGEDAVAKIGASSMVVLDDETFVGYLFDDNRAQLLGRYPIVGWRINNETINVDQVRFGYYPVDRLVVEISYPNTKPVRVVVIRLQGGWPQTISFEDDTQVNVHTDNISIYKYTLEILDQTTIRAKKYGGGYVAYGIADGKLKRIEFVGVLAKLRASYIWLKAFLLIDVAQIVQKWIHGLRQHIFQRTTVFRSNNYFSTISIRVPMQRENLDISIDAERYSVEPAEYWKAKLVRDEFSESVQTKIRRIIGSDLNGEIFIIGDDESPIGVMVVDEIRHEVETAKPVIRTDLVFFHFFRNNEKRSNYSRLYCSRDTTCNGNGGF